MAISIKRPFGQKYAFVVVGVVFLALLVSAGRASAPGVLLLPLQEAFGWSRGIISFSAGMGIFLYGLAGPFAAAAMQTFGIRRTMMIALAMMSAATFTSGFMSEAWHLIITWGIVGGIAGGGVAIVLAGTVANRWFSTHRGLVMGLLTASTATGTLLFLPALAALVEYAGWRAVVWTVSGAAAVLVPLVWLLVPERPESIGVLPYGATAPTPPAPSRGNPIVVAFKTLGMAVKRRDFWLLFATFFICGFTTNGLVGTHMIALCSDNGIPEVRAAGLLAMMGFFDLFGTTASGWLTDRYDARKLLFVYYALRGLSLIYLPFSDFSFYGLSLFAVFYGLDWIATVPPTLKLATQSFGERDAPIVFGWIVAGHQLGAASAAVFAGVMRDANGTYLQAFVIAGATGALAAVLSLLIGRGRREGVVRGEVRVA